MSPTYRILSIPRAAGADHPWTLEFGHDGTEPCVTCGAHLKRVCIVDGDVYGLDCAGAVFGIDAKAAKATTRKQSKARKVIENYISSRHGGPVRKAIWAATPIKAAKMTALRSQDTEDRIAAASAPVTFRAWTEDGTEYRGSGPGPLTLCDAADLRALAKAAYRLA